MSEAQNTQVIKDAYTAFQRGDIKTILDSLDDNVVWQGVIGTEGVLPQSGVRRGRAAVAEFFKQVADTTDFTEFTPQTFVAQGDIVVALGRYSAKLKPSGGIDVEQLGDGIHAQERQGDRLQGVQRQRADRSRVQGCRGGRLTTFRLWALGLGVVAA